MTQSRHTIQLCLLLACWLVSFLPRVAVGQAIKPAFIIECDNPDVTAKVVNYQLQGDLPSAEMDITATWTQGGASGAITGFAIDPRSNGKYFFLSGIFTPTGTGPVTIRLNVSPKANTEYKLDINRGEANDVTITVDGESTPTTRTTFKAGEKLTIAAKGWTKGDTLFHIGGINGVSKDGKLSFNTFVGDGNPETTVSATFTMPASEVSVFVYATRQITLPGVGTGETKRLLTITSPYGQERDNILTQGTKELEQMSSTNNIPGSIKSLAFKMGLEAYKEDGSIEHINTLASPMRIALPYPEGMTKSDYISVLQLEMPYHPSALIFPTMEEDSLSFFVSGFGSFMLCTARPAAGGVPTRVAFKESSLSWEVGAKGFLTYDIEPAGLPEGNREVTYRSSDASIATVSNKGELTAHKVGTCKIIIRTLFGGGLEDICTLTVNKYPGGITLDRTTLDLTQGESSKLGYKLTPDEPYLNGHDKVDWRSTDETIATVSADGTVTAHKAGTCDIIARTHYGVGYEATCALTVSKYPDGITLDRTTLDLTQGESSKLGYKLTPDEPYLNGHDKVDWRSTDETIATVSADGTVTALKVGTCDIIARTHYGVGYEATCALTVSKKSDPDPDPDPDPKPDPDPDPDPKPDPDPDNPTSVETPSDDAPRAIGRTGELILSSAKALRANVYSRTGHCLLSDRTVEGTFRLPLAAGIYFVRFADGTTHKVIIR